MTRIVYGVSGEGSGHSSRAREMLYHLEQRGHQLKVVTYDRGYRNLAPDFDVFETEGLHIASVDNKVSVVKTFTDNLKRLSQGHKKLQLLRQEVFKTFQPDCIITDFEPMTAYLATHYDLPLISLDNQHRIRYLHYPCPPKSKKDQLLTENIIRAMVPRPDVALVTSFYPGKPKNDRTFVFPPILRKEVLALTPSRGDRILVYLTSGFESLLMRLKEFHRERFLVYGYDQDDVDKNVTYRPFHPEYFLQDLAACKAVIATAGFTLITESLYLRKPYLALPMDGQYEQELNAFLLGKLGYGKAVRRITNEAISAFLYHLPDYEERLKTYQAGGNDAIKNKLDELLANQCTLACTFHKQRTQVE